MNASNGGPDHGMIDLPAGLFDDGQSEVDASGEDSIVEETVLVTRRALRAGGDEREDEREDEEFEATVVVARETSVQVDPDGQVEFEEIDEATVIVERTGEPVAAPSGTQPEDDEDHAETIARRTVEPVAHPAVMNAPTRRGRRTPSPAPVSDSVLNTSEHGPGVGRLESYTARTSEPLRIPVPDLGEGPAPTRDPKRALPSVSRRTRRSAYLGLGAIVLAGLAGLAGVIAVGAAVFRSLFG